MKSIKHWFLQFIIPFLVLSFILPFNLSAAGSSQIVVTKTNGDIVQGDLISVDIDDEVILVKDPEDVAGVKMHTNEIERIRIKRKAAVLKSTLTGLLIGAAAGFVLGAAVGGVDDEEEFIHTGALAAVTMSSIGIMSGFTVGVLKTGTYKTFKLNRMRFTGGKSYRISMLKYLKKRALRR